MIKFVILALVVYAVYGLLTVGYTYISKKKNIKKRKEKKENESCNSQSVSH